MDTDRRGEDPKKILLTGATGYIGGRLLGRLLQAGHEVHALAREPAHVRVEDPRLTLFQGDLLAGGAGLRRGRRHPVELCVGDTLDWWRVELIEPGRRLRLCAEMKVPGRAWLEFEVTPCEKGSEIRQTALFDPAGVWGRIYWYALYPLHQLVFSGMLRNIARQSE